MSTSGCVEGGNTMTSSTALLSKSTLGSQFNFEFTLQVLSLEFIIFTNIRGDHSFDLTRVKQQTQTIVLQTTVVGYNSEVLGAIGLNSLDEVLRNTTNTKTTNENLGTIMDILGSFFGTSEDLG